MSTSSHIGIGRFSLKNVGVNWPRTKFAMTRLLCDTKSRFVIGSRQCLLGTRDLVLKISTESVVLMFGAYQSYLTSTLKKMFCRIILYEVCFNAKFLKKLLWRLALIQQKSEEGKKIIFESMKCFVDSNLPYFTAWRILVSFFCMSPTFNRKGKMYAFSSV